MAVLVIIAVLATLLIPSFQQHIVRTRRSEAHAALLQLMQQQERWYSQTNSYLAFSSSSSEPEQRRFKWWSGSSRQTSAYEIEGRACDGEAISQCVQLIATPGTDNVDPQFRDSDCQQLTLTSTGLRLASGSGQHCWP